MILILVRIIILYIFLISVMRLCGKRQIGEMQLTELITALMLSELAVMPILDDTIPLSYAVVSILAVICLEIFNTFIVLKCNRLKSVLDGTPSIIIHKGELRIQELEKLRLSLEEFIGQLRVAGVSDIADVYYAILEINGRLSIFEKAKVGETECGIAHSVVVNGMVSKSNLRFVNLSESELNNKIKSKNLKLKDVFLYSVDDAGKENWILNNQTEDKK